MPAWAVAILAGAVGAFVGGVGTFAAQAWTADREEVRRRRFELLLDLLPRLDSKLADVYHSGSARHQLDECLERMRQLSHVSGSPNRTVRRNPGLGLAKSR
jgi:hypothetical protein